MSKSIAEIKNELDNASHECLEELWMLYGADQRVGVQKLVEKSKKSIEKIKEEKNRVFQMNQYEREYASYSFICGIDEVGRGPLAGPVVAGAVILPKDCEIMYINDSKKLSEKKREELFIEIHEKAVATGIGIVGPQRIDEINILQATYEAMKLAIKDLGVVPDLLLNDAVTIPGLDMKQVPIIKGDAKSASIAAASIIAKVTRDRLMAEYDEVLPGYGLAKNKGYGSSEHMEAIRTMGESPIHRKSFIKNIVRM